ncbi:tetratricopeptide repeat protein [Salinispora arenicola]|uniref:tetratricopeptide repeat protein n=1 Tax=Salinispora arenicola TaxID=168697 RepID=UPI0003A18806|nr:tetratricopeptide repeat protein [Salinispora arenicola]
MKADRVFVSHTSDIAGYPAGRSFLQAVLDAVGRSGMVAVDMRYFSARDGLPASYCQQRVRECEIYLVVVGFRYGSLVPDTDVSYTEMEFQEATLSGKVRLVFLLADNSDLPKLFTDEDQGPVARFRRRLRKAGLIVARFTNPDNLELEVFHALTQLASTAERLVPRQLPAAVAHFAGRSRELATLTNLLPTSTGSAGTMVISAVGGAAGVGKTALAVHWAHQISDRFPDGQLYVNLRGFDANARVVTPAEALRGFLDALGVPAERIPPTPDVQTALYRSMLAGRRILVVLDNARDADQIRPLLPGTPGCLAVVTSRNLLTPLVATEGAYPLALDVMSTTEARELLVHRLGAERVSAESDAAQQIITACARLPLALSIAAARARQAGFSLADLAAELSTASRRLDALDAGDAASQVRAVFSWSYSSLASCAARLFRLLGLHPGPDISAPAAASLSYLPLPETHRLLTELTRVNLLIEHLPGRYAFHDLMRDYATDLTHTRDTDNYRHVARTRLLDHYLHTAHAADQLGDPTLDAIHLPPPQPGVVPEVFANRGQADAWFSAECPVLLATVRQTADIGLDTSYTWKMAWTVADFLDRRGRWHDWAAVQRVALDQARRRTDRDGLAHAHHSLGRAYVRILGRDDDAAVNLHRALALYGELGDHAGQARTHHTLAKVYSVQGRYTEALHREQTAIELFQGLRHQPGLARALNAAGWFHSQLSDYRAALTNCQQALGLLQEIGDRRGEADAWHSLGFAHHHLAQHTRAVHCYQQALALFLELGARYEEADTLTHLGETHHAAGSPGTARNVWQQALDILTGLDHPSAKDVRAKLHDLGQHPPNTT